MRRCAPRPHDRGARTMSMTGSTAVLDDLRLPLTPCGEVVWLMTRFSAHTVALGGCHAEHITTPANMEKNPQQGGNVATHGDGATVADARARGGEAIERGCSRTSLVNHPVAQLLQLDREAAQLARQAGLDPEAADALESATSRADIKEPFEHWFTLRRRRGTRALDSERAERLDITALYRPSSFSVEARHPPQPYATT